MFQQVSKSKVPAWVVVGAGGDDVMGVVVCVAEELRVVVEVDVDPERGLLLEHPAAINAIATTPASGTQRANPGLITSGWDRSA